MRLPAAIAEQISIAVSELDPTGSLPDRTGHAHAAIPLLADIGGAVLLRSDGTVLELEWDHVTEQRPRHLEEMASTVPLVAGTERYPWLGVLLPPRPTDARTCPSCLGVGRFTPAGGSGRIFCGPCGALGWVAVQTIVGVDGASPRR
jgi:hypothetical protein